MARSRDDRHPLKDQVEDATKDADRRQGEDKRDAREATEEGRTGSEREQDVKSGKIAADQPSDDKTRVGEELKAEQEVPRPGDLQSERDLLDEPDKAADLLDDPTTTRMQRILKPGEQVDDPAIAVARLPDRQARHARTYLDELARTDGGAPFADRDPGDVHARPADLTAEHVHPFAARNVPEEPAFLLRDADLADDAEPVALDRRWSVDPDAPKAGQEGGAPLAEPTDRKHHPGAPWPGPGQSMAASPTASPEPGPEPAVQFEPPQDIRFEHKPEAAAGIIGPGAADQELRRLSQRSEVDLFQEQRTGKPQTTAEMIREQRLAARAEGEKVRAAQERDRGPRGADDGVPRDEAGQISLEHITDRVLAAIGDIYKGGDDTPEPFRLRIALEHAARRVFSAQWWDIHDKHFAKDKKPDEKVA
jgi:hypothetical protein